MDCHRDLHSRLPSDQKADDEDNEECHADDEADYEANGAGCKGAAVVLPLDADIHLDRLGEFI